VWWVFKLVSKEVRLVAKGWNRRDRVAFQGFRLHVFMGWRAVIVCVCGVVKAVG